MKFGRLFQIICMYCCCFKLKNEWVEWEHDLKLFPKGHKALKEKMGGGGGTKQLLHYFVHLMIQSKTKQNLKKLFI